MNFALCLASEWCIAEEHYLTACSWDSGKPNVPPLKVHIISNCLPLRTGKSATVETSMKFLFLKAQWTSLPPSPITPTSPYPYDPSLQKRKEWGVGTPHSFLFCLRGSWGKQNAGSQYFNLCNSHTTVEVCFYGQLFNTLRATLLLLRDSKFSEGQHQYVQSGPLLHLLYWTFWRPCRSYWK